MFPEERLRTYHNDNFKKTITKINERIYHFLGFGHSNVTMIIANHSIILVDALDNPYYSQALKKEIENISTLPIETLIYTHGHPDHRGGAGTFRDSLKEIIAFSPSKPPLKYYDKINDALMKRGAYQFGVGLSDEETISQGLGIREGHIMGYGPYDFVAPNTFYHEEKVIRQIDGVNLELCRMNGETDDTIAVYLPDDNVICCADNYYGCFPNLYAIRGTSYRDIATWVDSLRKIANYQASALLPGHTACIVGKEEVNQRLTDYADAIEYLLLATLDCINQGLDLEDTVSRVKLPEKYANASFLGEFYGTVEWSVRSIYQGYVGWFDGNPLNLMPLNKKAFKDLLLTISDEKKILETIHHYIEQEKYQEALTLLEVVDHQELRKTCLIGRAKQMTSANARHYYLKAAKEAH